MGASRSPTSPGRSPPSRRASGRAGNGCGTTGPWGSLRRYFDLFPAEQIRVWLYEDLRANAAAVVRDVFRFLGVDDAFTPDTSLAHNRSGVPRSERAIRLLNRPNPLRSALRALLPSDARRRIRIRLQDLLLAKPPSLDPVVRRDLVASYREDVLALGRLIGRDLSHWLA
jgi:hypothetical protein